MSRDTVRENASGRQLKKQVDLTGGNPGKSLLMFAFPMILGNLFQQFYNMADSMIVGNFVGEDALAAVGASYALTNVFIMIAIGGGNGASVLTSQYLGARQHGKMKTSISTALITFLAVSLVLGGLGFAMNGTILTALNTPENIMGQARLYLGIYFLGLPFLFMYNVLAAIFNALGDSRTPLYFLIGSSLGNIVLDYWFVAWLGLGVAGVAWATFIAQGVSAILALGTLARRLGALKTDRRTVLFSAVLLGQIAAIAVPSIMQQSVLSVGNMFVQEIVNRYGSAVIAGYSGAVKLNTFAINAFMSLGGCLSSYTAQNLGAGKRERIPLGFKTGVRLSFYATIPFFLLYFVFSRQMMGLFLGAGSTRAIESGMEFLRIVSPMYFMISIKLMTDGIIRGSGAMTYFVLATVPDLILRIIVANILTGRFGSTGIWMAWPFGWIAATLLTVIFYRRIVSGKFRIRI